MLQSIQNACNSVLYFNVRPAGYNSITTLIVNVAACTMLYSICRCNTNNFFLDLDVFSNELMQGKNLVIGLSGGILMDLIPRALDNLRPVYQPDELQQQVPQPAHARRAS